MTKWISFKPKRAKWLLYSLQKNTKIWFDSAENSKGLNSLPGVAAWKLSWVSHSCLVSRCQSFFFSFLSMNVTFCINSSAFLSKSVSIGTNPPLWVPITYLLQVCQETKDEGWEIQQSMQSWKWPNTAHKKRHWYNHRHQTRQFGVKSFPWFLNQICLWTSCRLTLSKRLMTSHQPHCWAIASYKWLNGQ